MTVQQPGAGHLSIMALPSYEAATSRDPVACFAPYVCHEDLFSCALVCRAWQQSIDNELWGEPARCFGLGEKSPLASFLLFLKALPSVQLSRRSLVHTLSMERCIAGIYTTLPDSWFSDLLLLLPGLRRLLAPGVSFIDHQGIITGQRRHQPLAGDSGSLVHYNLHQLNLSNLAGTTAGSLVALLSRLPELRVLDLSRTAGAGHPDVLRTIGTHLRALKSLKLRWLELTDDAVALLARGVQVRLERLDVTGNLLTDAMARHLLDWCFMPPEFADAVAGATETLAAPESDGESDAQFGDEEAWMATAAGLRERGSRDPVRLCGGAGGHPGDMDKGLMHLHIADNSRITATGVRQLLGSTRLRTLDCGVFRHHLAARREAANAVVVSIMRYGFRRLRNLRIDWAAVLRDGSSCLGAVELLYLSRLPRLKTLALANVPLSTTDASFADSLRQFLHQLTVPSLAGDLETVVLEISEGWDAAEKMGFYSLEGEGGDHTQAFSGRLNGEFSFFEDEGDVPWESASGDRREPEPEISILDIVRGWRERCRRQCRWWGGSIKIMRDIGGSETSERGADGNRWGVSVSEIRLQQCSN